MILAQKWTRRQMDQIEDPHINPYFYSQLIFEKVVHNTGWRKDILFNKCYWENWISTCRRLKLHPCLSHCTKIHKTGYRCREACTLMFLTALFIIAKLWKQH
jgi:hypothetical protein